MFFVGFFDSHPKTKKAWTGVRASLFWREENGQGELIRVCGPHFGMCIGTFFQIHKVLYMTQSSEASTYSMTVHII